MVKMENYILLSAKDYFLSKISLQFPLLRILKIEEGKFIELTLMEPFQKTIQILEAKQVQDYML
ncbi:hypothetical protein D3C85_1744170 [compost metagenome]